MLSVRIQSSVTARAETYIARGGVILAGQNQCDGTFGPTPHSPSRTSMTYLEEVSIYATAAEQHKCCTRSPDTTCGFEAAEALQ